MGILENGASGSLLTAMMQSESFMPAMCWKAPDMPMARYTFGFTVLPDVPTCRALGSHILSMTGRDPERTAFRMPASSS